MHNLFSIYIPFRAVKLVLLLVFLTSLQSCSLVKDIELKGVEDYEMLEMSLERIKMKINLKVYNPNNFKIKIKGGNIHVNMSGIDLGDFNITEKVTLEKKKEQVLELIVETKMQSIFSSGLSSVMGLLSSKGTASVHFKGEIKASAIGLTKTVKIDETESVQL